jgi:hypothetical protein
MTAAVTALSPNACPTVHNSNADGSSKLTLVRAMQSRSSFYLTGNHSPSFAYTCTTLVAGGAASLLTAPI